MRQFLKFNLVGLLNTAIDVGVYSALVAAGVWYLAAQPLSYGCGLVNSFLWNKRWTFRASGSPAGREFARFVVVNAVSLGLLQGLLYLLVDTAGLSEILGKLVAAPAAVIVNFLGNRRWVFRA